MKLLKVMLFLLPFIWSVLCVPFVNRLEPMILGLPFLMFWEIAGIFITSACIAAFYYLDYGKLH